MTVFTGGFDTVAIFTTKNTEHKTCLLIISVVIRKWQPLPEDHRWANTDAPKCGVSLSDPQAGGSFFWCCGTEERKYLWNKSMLWFPPQGSRDALFLCCQTHIYSLVILSFPESAVWKLWMMTYGRRTEHFPSFGFNDLLLVLLTRPPWSALVMFTIFALKPEEFAIDPSCQLNSICCGR